MNDITKYKDTVDFLKDSFFNGMPSEQLCKLMTGRANTEKMRKGEVVIEEGGYGDKFYIILQGRVEVYKRIGEKIIVLKTEEAGEFFGEMALIDDHPRTATVKCLEDCVFLTISRDDFKVLLGKYPLVATRLASILSQNLRRTDEHLVNMISRADDKIEKISAKLHKAELDLHQEDKFSFVGKLLSGILHDVKNPVSNIIGIIEMLADNSLDRELKAEFQSDAKNEAYRILEMVNELMTFLRGEEFYHMDYHELDKLFNEIRKGVAIQLNHNNITFEYSNSFKEPLYFDYKRISSVFYNIIQNAVEAMPNGGHIAINISKIKDKVHFQIKDTGIGMTEETLKKVFHDFFTFGKEKGSGLGLSICKRFIEKHNGTIKVESALYRGTSFFVTLPVSTAPDK